jgi:hypothetical protein
MQADRSVVVPVTFVGRVPVTVMHVVGVSLVRHRNVAAIRSVLVRVALMLRVPSQRALVNVVVVDAVHVSLVHIVDVISVRHRDVATALAVGMLVVVVLDVHGGVWHGGSPSSGRSFHQDINI